MPSPGPVRVSSSPDRTGRSAADREVLDYLGKEIQPALRRGERTTLVRAVTAAVGSGSVADLGRLAERHRRELLETIDARLAAGRPAPTPRALVRLTSVIATAPEPNARRAHIVASPAR
ncbi:MAG: hypothetical protein L3K01_04060 [Thermoplasmata archaeon]|nr:hypothetical protein [Thermoplasmata archaeon]